ncbi:hypothetical protein BKA69DRAFT_1038888 [Paraphysoderma sedebokerense]|nr:hypothetical protein BKA69DRAFT_1038888 [Paraphysoderma sedebokerense]
MSDMDNKLNDLLKKLEVEQKCKAGGELMRRQLTDKAAIAQCEASLAETQKRIDFLNTEIGKLQRKRSVASVPEINVGNGLAQREPSTSGMSAIAEQNGKNNGLAVSVDKLTSSESLHSTPHSDGAPDAVASPTTPTPTPTTPGVNQQSSILSSFKKTLSASALYNQVNHAFSGLGLKSKNQVSATSNGNATSANNGTGLPGYPTANLGSMDYMVVSGPPRSLPQDEVVDATERANNLVWSKSGMPLSTKKVSTKLRDMTYKLELEQKVRNASEKMVALYAQADAIEKKSKSERTIMTNDLAETVARIDAIRKSLQKYQGLFVGDDSDEEDQTTLSPQSDMQGVSPAAAIARKKAKKLAYSGTLYLRVVLAKIPPSMKNALSLSQSDSYVAIIRVDGTANSKSKVLKLSKSKDKTGADIELPFNQEFSINVDKAQDVEIAIAEQNKSGEVKGIVGLFWFRIADLVQEMEVQKVASRRASIQPAASTTTTAPTAAATTTPPANPSTENKPPPLTIVDNYPEQKHLDSWFELDPVGQVLVRLAFSTATDAKRKPSRLGRQGAVRKRRQIQTVMNGHKFTSMALNYQVLKCALCCEFIAPGGSYSCEDCKYTCHKKCVSKVVTKCIAAGSADMDQQTNNDAEYLQHQIPHRFQPTTNLSANWCCHCGHVLPLGKKGAKKCMDCGVTAHLNCSVLVPNYCGMSMQMANKMIAEIKAANAARKRTEQLAAAHAAQQSLKDQRRPSNAQGSALPQLPPIEIPATPPQQSAFKESLVPIKKVTIDDFQFLAVLGKGNFGKVMLAEEKATKILYAIKVLKKDFIIENDEVESTKSEKRIFLTANHDRHPFLLGLHSCFQTDTRIYFVMEYVSGGDLMLHIQREQFSERRAKFYACEVLMALEFFHQNGIVYRDLKLDNILLGLDGHVKLADYGLCKENMAYGATTNTFCGTPEFMAPEILLEQNYGRAVDWWAFGVLIYEMLLGQSPFRGDDEDEIFASILEDEVLYPITMSRDAVSICQRLLTRDPSKRLGGGKADSEDVKRHPFFKDVNWQDMYDKKIAPPFVPRISHAKDVSNFDEEFTRELPVLTPVNTVLDPADQAEFKDFTTYSLFGPLSTANVRTLQLINILVRYGILSRSRIHEHDSGCTRYFDYLDWQARLGDLVGQVVPEYYNSLPADAKRRVQALKNLQRSEIVAGKYEPTDEEAKKTEEEEEEEKEAPATESKEPVTGVPEFWLRVLMNHPHISEMITEEDQEVLKSLIDIKVAYLPDNPGFKLDFQFSSNDYFTNEVLTKTYYLSEPTEANRADDYMYDHAEGTEINWKEGKNLAFRVETKKQRHKGTNQTRIVKKTVPTETFFNFFKPPKVPAEDEEITEEEAQELDEKLEADYEIGEDIKEKLIPDAIGWFTGESVELDDDEYGGQFGGFEDDDDDDEEEDDESDDDESDEDDEDGDQSGKPPAATGDNPPECKQQ